MSFKIISQTDTVDFDCILDVEIYMDVARDSGEQFKLRGDMSCDKNCTGCPLRQFPPTTVH